MLRETWCAGGDLNPHACAYAPQTYVSTSSTTRARTVIDRNQEGLSNLGLARVPSQVPKWLKI